MVFDASDPVIDTIKFDKQDWTSSEFGDANGIASLPMNAPEPRVLYFCIRGKVDANHDADKVTRRSMNGYLMCIDCDLVHWFSKK